MLPRLRKRLPIIQAALIFVLGIVLVWQLLVLGGTIWDYAMVKRSAARWESRIDNAEEKKNKEPESDKKEYAELKQGGLIGLPKPPSPPPQLTAIMGEVAIINNQEARVGENAGGMKIVEIQTNKVILEKDGQRSELTVFSGI